MIDKEKVRRIIHEQAKRIKHIVDKDPERYGESHVKKVNDFYNKTKPKDDKK